MRLLTIFLLFFAGPLRAEPLRVVTTVAPVYGIVFNLMQGVTTPTPIVTTGMDPHHFSLKPSQLFALNDADIVFAIGGEMEPWLPRVLPGITGEIVLLANIPLLVDMQLPLRELDHFGDDHDDHDEVNAIDPHMWLDPDIAQVWVMFIEQKLSMLDPQNASIYRANAIRQIAEISQARDVLLNVSVALGAQKLVASHDSLQYLEHYFELNIVGAASSASGEEAGARTLSRLARDTAFACLLIDTSETALRLETILPDLQQARFDPLGNIFAGEPRYLKRLFLSIAAALENCITEP